jgi:hypothetical protein
VDAERAEEPPRRVSFTPDTAGFGGGGAPAGGRAGPVRGPYVLPSSEHWTSITYQARIRPARRGGADWSLVCDRSRDPPGARRAVALLCHACLMALCPCCAGAVLVS